MPATARAVNSDDDGPSIAVNCLDGALTTAAQRAWRRLGLSDKEAAGVMGVDAGQLSRQLRGCDGNYLAVQRQERLGLTWLGIYVEELAEIAGKVVCDSDQESAAVEQLARAAVGLLAVRARRMKKASFGNDA